MVVCGVLCVVGCWCVVGVSVCVFVRMCLCMLFVIYCAALCGLGVVDCVVYV